MTSASAAAACLLDTYSVADLAIEEIAKLLLARGISPAVVAAVPVEMVNVATQDEVGASIVLNLLPVVMITAYGDNETERKAHAGGAEGFFTKPIDFSIGYFSTASPISSRDLPGTRLR